MFLAHKNSIGQNSYHVLNQYDKKKVLVKSENFSLVSNICPHQQSLLSVKNGTGNRVCPYHNWSFTIGGSPITSGRTGYYCQNNTALKTEQVYEWNSLLFSTDVDFKCDHDFSKLILMEHRIDSVKADYRNIMDLFLDVDHIPTVHAGVYDMIGITDTNVNWQFYHNGSIQTVAQGASWIALYPNTMIEWQKGSLFVTVALPIDNNLSKVCVYKYMDYTYSTLWNINEKVWETAWAQDKAQAELITKFSENLSNLEPQKIHYRDFLRSHGTN
jgi:phenylpropionate dioxygenase-like ring-hydroxylating dioxygenase large terminal subunit